MNLPAPILRITDGTDSVDLISPARGWHLTAWEPSYPNEDIGYRQSPLASGRAPVTRRYDYPVEQMTYVLDADSQDVFIAMRRKLDRLLIKATDYWKDDWRTEPVWLEARSTYESDTRYAVVVSSKIGPYPYPYGSAFANRTGSSAQDGISLSLEHTFWQDEVPGSSHCIEASAQHYRPQVLNFLQVVTDDDAYVETNGAAITLNSADLRFGSSAAGSYHTGIRWTPMNNLAQGATIVAAYITYYAENNLAANTVKIRIYGEDADSAATFTTYANFMGRTRTTAYADVAAWPAHVAGTCYVTADITSIIQEIVNRAGWASGNAMVLFIENNGSTAGGVYRDMSSVDSVAYPAPELIIIKETTTLAGRAATCLPEVYVANKHNDADVTHIFTCTAAGVFGADQAASWNFDLFEGGAAGPANGDMTYFGSGCLATNPRPFCSMVFDIGTAATYGAGDFVTWQYWNGAWVNFGATNFYDEYDAAAGPTTQPFTYTGVASISWYPPSDWAVTVVNGRSGYWIRLVVTEATGITRAQQHNGYVYSAITPFLDIDDTTAAGLDQLRGDLPMPIKLTNWGATSSYMAPTRFIVGMRTLSRGADFRAYINFGGQNAAGVIASPAGTAVLVASNMAPCGKMVQQTFDLAITPFGDYVSIVIPRATYHGRFHALVRYNFPDGSDGDVRVRLTYSYYGTIYTKAASLIVSAAPNVLTADLGRIELPYGSSVDIIYLNLEQTVAAARTVNLIDLVLIPADEWIGEWRAAPNYSDYDGLTYIIDSVTYPKEQIRPNWDAGGGILRPLYYFGSQPVTIGQRDQQRVWFFMSQLATAAPTEDAPACLLIAADLDATARYLNMRGDD